MSRTAKSGMKSSRILKAASPSCAIRTTCPSCSSHSASASASSTLSSTTRIFRPPTALRWSLSSMVEPRSPSEIAANAQRALEGQEGDRNDVERRGQLEEDLQEIRSCKSEVEPDRSAYTGKHLPVRGGVARGG